MLRKLFIIFCICLITSPVVAQSQTEMIEYAINRYETADKKLDKIYKSILVKFSSDKGFVKNLKKSQASWKNYKQVQIETLFPKSDNIAYDYGSNYSIHYYSELYRLTDNRVKELKHMTTMRCLYVPHKAGDVCSEENLKKLFK